MIHGGKPKGNASPYRAKLPSGGSIPQIISKGLVLSQQCPRSDLGQARWVKDQQEAPGVSGQ